MGALRLTAHDFSTMHSLAAQAGIAPERVTALQRRCQIEPQNRPGAPYAVLYGAQEAIRAMLSALAGGDIAQKTLASTAAAVVIGRNPDSVRPLATAWPQIKTDQFNAASLIVLRATDRIPDATLEALASLGTIDQAILATRLTQPCNQDERHLTHALAAIAETLRIVLTGRSAAEMNPDEAGELLSYAGVQADGAGFNGARFTGAVLWFPDGPHGLPGETGDLSGLLNIDESHSGRFREAVLTKAVINLASVIENGLAAQPQTQNLPASPDDLERLIAQFHGHLQGLGKHIGDLAINQELRNSGEARALAADKIRNWVNGQNLQAATLTLADKFRPGLKARLLAALEGALAVIQIEAKPAKPLQTARQSAVFSFLARMAWARAVVAIALGVFSAFAVQLLLPVIEAMLPSEIDGWVKRLLAPAFGGLTGVAAYFILSQPWVIGRGEAPREPFKPPTSPLKGWPLAEEKLLAEFASHLRDDGVEAGRKSLAAIKHRLQPGSER